jgi:D-glycero-alpha-D-manno-heptose 1-phosphate guanylyltransferase
MINEAIILAGGLGTRLRSAVPDLPKCMAPVAGKPFLEHVINYFSAQGITRFVLAVGYKNEVIVDFIKDRFRDLNIDFSIETDLLGTGGAIRLACRKVTSENVLVTNGDTMFKIDARTLASFHELNKAHCSVVLKPMQNFDRYGVVEINAGKRITRFKEKQFYESGLISGGIYALNVPSFKKEELPVRFSFEKDYLEALYTTRDMFGLVEDSYFIDIGIPTDFEQAQKDFG